MRTFNHWIHDHQWDSASSRLHWSGPADFLKTVWLGLLLVILGIFAIITSVIIAYPVMAHIAAKFFQ